MSKVAVQLLANLLMLGLPGLTTMAGNIGQSVTAGNNKNYLKIIIYSKVDLKSALIQAERTT